VFQAEEPPEETETEPEEEEGGDGGDEDEGDGSDDGADDNDFGNHDGPRDREHLLGGDKMVAELQEMLDKFNEWAESEGYDTSDAGKESDDFGRSLQRGLLLGDGSDFREPGKLRLEGTQFMDLFFFAKGESMHVTSTTGGKHNPGSVHGLGRAIDVRTWDKKKSVVDQFIDWARANGIRVRDERTRPKGQKEWSGPHIHLSVGERSRTDRPFKNSPARERVLERSRRNEERRVREEREHANDWSDVGTRNHRIEGPGPIRVLP
jgi:hypothetical protein